MGGEIVFGVRHTMGKKPREVVMSRWTNDFPWRMALPGFLEQGTDLRKFVDQAKPNGKWPGSKLLTRARLGEYGIVLVDFPTRTCLSRNDYTHTGEITVIANSSAYDDEIEMVRGLLERGWLAGAKDFGLQSDQKNIPLGRLKKMIERLQTGTKQFHEWVAEQKKTRKNWSSDLFPPDAQRREINDKVMELIGREAIKALRAFVVNLSPKALSVDHVSERKPQREEVLAWMRERGWKTPLDHASFKPYEEE